MILLSSILLTMALIGELDSSTCRLIAQTDAGKKSAAAGSPSPHQPRPLAEFAVSKHGRLITLTVTLPDRTEVPFLLDTGAAVTIIDESLKPSGVQPSGRRRFSTAAGDIDLDLFAAPQLRIGSLGLGDVPGVAYMSLADFQTASGKPICGILGCDVLEQRPFEIDFDNGVVKFWATAPQEWSRDELVQLTRRQGICHVQCKLPGGREERFILATGSTGSTIREATFDKLVAERELNPFGTGAAATAKGVIRTPKGILSSFGLATWRHEDLRFDRDRQSMLGISYLARYRLRVDMANGLAYLAPGDRFELKEGNATCGLAIQVRNGRKVVERIDVDGAADRAGLLAGDIIEFIDGQAMAELDMFDVGQLLTSRAGVELELRILRKGEKLNVTMTPLPRISVTK